MKCISNLGFKLVRLKNKITIYITNTSVFINKNDLLCKISVHSKVRTTGPERPYYRSGKVTLQVLEGHSTGPGR